MKDDILKNFLASREALLGEKKAIEERLKEINEALGVIGVYPSAGGRRGPRVGISLKDAVIKVTCQKPMTKHEILDAVQALGYRFRTDNPLNSLGVILYGKKIALKNDNGYFSYVGEPVEGLTGGSPEPVAEEPAPAPKKGKK